MKKNASNYFKVTLRKIKVPSEVEISSFLLKLEIFGQSEETEKITSREKDLNKCYYYLIPENENDQQWTLTITAIEKTLVFFDSQISKVVIPIQYWKLFDKKEWFTLKNSKDENSIMVLMSFADMREQKKMREHTQSMQSYNCNNSRQYTNPNNASCISNNISNERETKLKITGVLNKSKSSLSNDENAAHSTSMVLARNNIEGDDGSHHISNLPEELRSTRKQKQDETYLTTLDSNLGDNEGNIFEQKTFDARNEPGIGIGITLGNKSMNNHTAKSGNRRLKHYCSAQLPDELTKMKECLNKDKERIQNFESKLIVEKESVDRNLKKFKEKTEAFEAKKVYYSKIFKKIENELEKIKLEKEIMEFNKKIFCDLNTFDNIHTTLRLESTLDKMIAVSASQERTSHHQAKASIGSFFPLEKENNNNEVLNSMNITHIENPNRLNGGASSFFNDNSNSSKELHSGRHASGSSSGTKIKCLPQSITNVRFTSQNRQNSLTKPNEKAIIVSYGRPGTGMIYSPNGKQRSIEEKKNNTPICATKTMLPRNCIISSTNANFSRTGIQNNSALPRNLSDEKNNKPKSVITNIKISNIKEIEPNGLSSPLNNKRGNLSGNGSAISGTMIKSIMNGIVKKKHANPPSSFNVPCTISKQKSVRNLFK